MAIMTVTGPVEKDALGVVLPHEHLFIDLTNQFSEPADEPLRHISSDRVSLSNLGYLRRNPYAIRDNLVIDDIEVAVAEARFFAEAGGKTMVDCTSIGIGRQVERLRTVAERTGLNVVAGCGYYTQDTHPEEMDELSVEHVTDAMVRDLNEGIDGTGVRAGIIGEIGVSEPMRPAERKSLQAAARASMVTGAPVQVHTYPWSKNGLDAVDVLVSEGIDPRRAVICHVDAEPDVEYILQLLQTDVYVEFENFGKEFYIPRSGRSFAGGNFCTDVERVRCIRQLADRGYEGRVLVSNDICLKQMLHTYGGWGYDHILTNIVPMMLDEGLPRATVDRLVRENPAAWLSQEE